MSDAEPGSNGGARRPGPLARLLGGPVRRTVLVALAGFVLVVVAINVVNRGGDEQAAGGGGGAGARREVPTPPAAMVSPGSWVESTVGEDGSVEVRQWIASATPVRRLQLTTADPDALPGTVESSGVVVSGYDGRRLAVRGSVGTRTLDVRLRAPATEIYLTYTIAGDTLSDEESTVAGRSVARVTAMDVVAQGDGPEQGPVVRVVRGPGTVTSAGCLTPADGYEAPPRACGSATEDGGWQVQLDGEQRHDRVIAGLEA